MTPYSLQVIPGSGARILLEEKVFTGVAAMEFKTGFSSDYDEYQFELFNVMQNSWPGQLSFVASTNGGASYDTNGVYKFAGWTKWTEGIRELANKAASAWGDVGIDMTDNVAYGMCGTMKLKTPGVVAGNNVHSSYEAVTTRIDDGTLNAATATYQGFYVGAAGARINAVKFFASSVVPPATCNFTGMIRLYGVKN